MSDSIQRTTVDAEAREAKIMELTPGGRGWQQLVLALDNAIDVARYTERTLELPPNEREAQAALELQIGEMLASMQKVRAKAARAKVKAYNIGEARCRMRYGTDMWEN